MAQHPVTSKKRPRWSGCVSWGIAAAAIVLPLCGALLILSAQPSLAAQGADMLRAVVGDEAVANLEMVVFQAQDVIQKIEYSVGIATADVPWQAAPMRAVDEIASESTSPALSFTPIPSTPSKTPLTSTETTAAQPSQPISTPVPSPTPTVTTTSPAWPPAALSPLGALEGEGRWLPYIQDTAGRTVAYRAYLQPDTARPFAVVAVIAIDLEHTRLHFVLGFEEPYAPNSPRRTGAMPGVDKTPGRLLAMFNGGFKAQHGHFGAMADGVIALPGRDGLGTLVIEQDGRVRMGVWGSTIKPTATDVVRALAWRQNGPLVIEDGQINPRIYNNSPKDWGYTVNDVSPTWRSGIGISPDGRTLFYFAGASLNMEALAKSMLAAGAAQGMQLDINTYWVHFVAVRDDDGRLLLEPLFPAMMKENVKRYLYPYSRDYFYITGP